MARAGDVFIKDRIDNEDNREVFSEIFGSIFGQLPICQQQLMRDNFLDLMIWDLFTIENQELFNDKSFNHLSRYAPQSSPWMSLNLVLVCKTYLTPQ